MTTRSSLTPIAAVVGLLLISPIVLFFGFGSPPPAAASEPSNEALGDIPGELLGVYRSAADDCGMPWEVLAAIGKIESDHGRSDLPGVHSGTNEAGAAGPMQFLAPTWEAYKVDGDHDGDTDIYDSVDSIWSAANYLCANGANENDPNRLRNAIWNYNHSDEYVDAVIEQAARYRQAGAVRPGTDAFEILNNPRLTVYPGGRSDLENGEIDQQVIDLIAWALERHSITISSLKTGHSEFVNGTDRRSNHFFGRGVDFSNVDGEAVRDESDTSRVLAEEIDALGPGRPDETGVPWSDMEDRPGFFNDSDHEDHIHAGFDTAA